MVESGTPKSAKTQVFDDLRTHYGATRHSTELAITTSLRSRYPDCSTTVTPAMTGILSFAKAGQAEAKLDTTMDEYSALRVHFPVTDRSGREGTTADRVSFGKYDYTWKNLEFIIYSVTWTENGSPHRNEYILCKKADDVIVDGHSKRTDELIAAASQWSEDLHDEVWVFDQEYWSKDSELWKSVQDSTWDDVILDDTMKKTLVEDVEGFFDRKDDYKQFGVPWKRGIIFHGIPGNGKTISIKALVHFLSSRSDPVPTLYVKSLAGCRGPHYAIREIFTKARQTAPCLLVFEDLDSLITDKVKSFFLNEVDGLESNDGIMMIGSTNYLDRLDPGIAKRPSRFDRKYHFALPAVAERIRYCEYWRSKLANNKSIDFPPKLSAAIAEITEGFSFAYLKEAFITSLLVIVANQRGGTEKLNGTVGDADTEGVDGNALWRTLSKQVEILRAEQEESLRSVDEAAQNGISPTGRYDH
ncbi:MAG: hypothetical protein L6R42_001059 [Xanthoria sp. 1 TBL-2021]|nr:MAG: hypothetical protein L6R42_001059 [Xanthoria sp. 1 TBL-2021]